MRLISILQCTVCFWIAISNHICGQQKDSFQNIYHSDVHLGMNSESLKLNHPKLVRTSLNPSGQLSQSDYGLVEIQIQSGHRTATWYYIMGDILRGVSSTIPFTEVESESGTLNQYLRSIYGNFTNGMTREKDEQILRTDGIEGFVVTAEHWKSAKSLNEFFFVATNQEISIVWFDPHYLGKERLFVSPSLKATVDENGKRLLMKLGGISDSKKINKRVPISDVPRPIIARPDETVANNRPASAESNINLSQSQELHASSPTRTSSLPSMEENDQRWVVWLITVIAILGGCWFSRKTL
jgi:hypothetical protein